MNKQKFTNKSPDENNTSHSCCCVKQILLGASEEFISFGEFHTTAASNGRRLH